LSGLDMSIRRLMTQRACLERAADLAAQLPGPALQLGFGDGSAFDHLREILRRRELIVFDAGPASAAADAPAPGERISGDLRETLPLNWNRLKRSAALAHFNFPVTDQTRLAAELAPLIAPILRAGAVVVSEKPLDLPGWEALPPPDGVREGRHFLYRAS
jgi:hypothetical protein